METTERSKNDEGSTINLSDLLKELNNNQIIFDSKNRFIEIKNIKTQTELVIDHHSLTFIGAKFTPEGVIIKNCQFNAIKVENVKEKELLQCFDCQVDKIDIVNSAIRYITILSKYSIEKIHISNVKCLDLKLDYKEADLILLDEISSNQVFITGQSIIQLSLHSIDAQENIVISNNNENFNIGLLKINEHIKKYKISGARDKNFYIHEIRSRLGSEPIHAEISNLCSDKMEFEGLMLYAEIILNLTDVTIEKNISFKSVALDNSYFRSIDLSKCQFNDSLIDAAKFFECDVERIPDFPIRKVGKFIPIAVSSIVMFMTLSIAIVNDIVTKQNIVHTTFTLLYTLLTLSAFTSILLFFKHSATLDEKREVYKDIKWLEFAKLFWKSTKAFFWKMDKAELQKLKEIESLNRQLKVAFESSKDVQNAHEFLYSEMLMKIRQRNIWMNLVNVDLYNYLINGFGRRWLRALINLFIAFFLSMVLFLTTTPPQFKVESSAPDFILEANRTVFGKVVPIALDENQTNTDYLSSAVKLTSVYTLSKLDVIKIKTANWFEETSFWNFLKGNVIGLVLLFLLGSFILAFKRRLEK